MYLKWYYNKAIIKTFVKDGATSGLKGKNTHQAIYVHHKQNAQKTELKATGGKMQEPHMGYIKNV